MHFFFESDELVICMTRHKMYRERKFGLEYSYLQDARTFCYMCKQTPTEFKRFEILIYFLRDMNAHMRYIRHIGKRTYVQVEEFGPLIIFYKLSGQ